MATNPPTSTPPSTSSAVELATLLAEFFRRIGLAKSAAAALATIVVATLSVSTAWSAKADKSALDKHVAEAGEMKAGIDARLAQLELRSGKLEAMQQVTLDQVIYSRDRLDTFLVGRGLPPATFPPPVPTWTPIPPIAIATPSPTSSPP